MKFILAILFFPMALGFSAVQAEDHPAYLDFSPALPKESPEQFIPPGNPPYLTYEQSVPINLDINKEANGKKSKKERNMYESSITRS